MDSLQILRSSDFQIFELQDVANITMGQSPESEYYNDLSEGIPLIQGNADLQNRKSIGRIFTTHITKICDKGDFILSVRAPVGTIGIASFFSCIGRGVCAIQPTNINRDYLYQILLFNEVKWKKIEQGSTFTAVSSEDVKKFKILITNNISEQKAIAAVLSTWDEAIQKTEALIKQKELRKKWLMQQLLTGKKRLKGFENKTVYHKTELGLKIPLDWVIVRVKDIFSERKQTSKDQLAYPLFSLTIENGLTEKTERYERSFLLKNKEENLYKLIYPNDILFNPMNLRFGAIAKSKIDKIVSVSAYYNSLYPKIENAYVDYYEALFKTPIFMNLYDRIAIGSLIEKKRVHLSNFNELEIPFPSYQEQQAIAKVLQTADKEINLLKTKVDKLREQKKGLMQVLLTGKKRLNLNLQNGSEFTKLKNGSEFTELKN